MTGEKVIEVIETYRRLFLERGVGKIDFPHDEMLAIPDLGMEHCHGMLDRMIDFVKEGRMDKVFRWLGFIQGFLWANGIYSLTELKDQNRPPESIVST